MVVLGGLWGVFGEGLGRSWPLGASWGILDQIDPKIDPKIEPKSRRIREGQNRSGATPVVVSEPAAGRRKPENVTPKNYHPDNS